MERYEWGKAGRWTTVTGQRKGRAVSVLVEFYRVVGGSYAGEITRDLPLARGMAAAGGGRVEAVGLGAALPVPAGSPPA